MVEITKLHLFANYIAIYHYFKNIKGSTTFWVFEFSKIEFSIILKFHKVYFFKELEFLGLNFHDKLNFHKLEFQKVGRSLYISKLVVDC